MSLYSIDQFALAGFQYALGICQLDAINFTSEIDVMAFNAGIRQANDRHNLVVPSLTTNTTKVINNLRIPHHKELQSEVCYVG